MKILFVQKVKALVGSEKYFLEIIPALEEIGIKTEFACIYLEKDELKTLPFIKSYGKLGLKIHILKVKSDKAISKICGFINKTFKDGDFDLVHSHLIHADLWCAMLKAVGRITVPLVSTKHGYDETYTSTYGFSAKHLKLDLYYILCKYSERFINSSFAVSKGLMNFFIDGKISPKDKIRTIHHGFDLPEIKTKKNIAYRFSKQQLVILGRIIPFKGHHLLVEALRTVKRQFPLFKLLIIGHGDEEYISNLKIKISEYELSENIDFLGYKSNIYDYLINSDVMIVPSVSEGFGLVFLEALNAKIPLVGFNVPATNEIIVNNQTGILIPPFDCKKMGLSIIEVLENETNAKALTDAGYQRLKNHFSLKRMLEETIKFYEDALKMN